MDLENWDLKLRINRLTPNRLYFEGVNCLVEFQIHFNIQVWQSVILLLLLSYVWLKRRLSLCLLVLSKSSSQGLGQECKVESPSICLFVCLFFCKKKDRHSKRDRMELTDLRFCQISDITKNRHHFLELRPLSAKRHVTSHLTCQKHQWLYFKDVSANYFFACLLTLCMRAHDRK